jgi:hypothetical protein
MMKFSVPPGYVRKNPPAKPKLDRFIPVIDGILRDDKSRPKKQQHTAKRIFERLRDEYGFTGGITIVKDYVAGFRQRTQEMFVPLMGTVRNLVCEAMMMRTEGASYGDRERPAGPATGRPRSEGRIQQGWTGRRAEEGAV